MRELRASSAAFAAAYIVLLIGLFLALGGAAYAASPTTDQYGPKAVEVEVSTTTGSRVGSATATTQGSLPTTGLSLLGVVVAGGALVAAGAGLRRRENRKR